MARNIKKKIRVGVVGVGRGMSFTGVAAQLNGLELVAICDKWKPGLKRAKEKLGVATYEKYDDFLNHKMDAVVLANYFHQHAPFAVKALEAGFHVMSETAACKTLAEGVALARAVEKSGKIYFFAENYPFFNYNQEMRRLYRSGEIGELYYGEGEYIHPGTNDYWIRLSPGFSHWRNNMPETYYCTHALGPLMYITSTRPVSVNGFCIPYHPGDEPMRIRKGDKAGVILCKMNNNAVVKLLQDFLPGEQNYTRLHGTCGLMENTRHGKTWYLRIKKDPRDRKPGQPEEIIYNPDFPHHSEAAQKTGHGGGDFFTSYYFSQAIRSGKQPFLDVYRGIDMSITGILAYRSALNNSVCLEVPDFRKESVRQKYEDDDWSPYPEDHRPGQPFPSIKGDYKIPRRARDHALRLWKSMGYQESELK